MSKDKNKADNAVIDLEHARVRLRSRAARATPESLDQDLEVVRGLLDQGLTIEARTRLSSLLSEARNQPELLAEARRSLSVALEMQGNYRESLDAVAMYEPPEARTKLNPTLGTLLRVQISLANNYNGDHPKAISLLKATLRGLPEQGVEVGAVYAALARVYRSINEYPIARDYSHRARECYRQTGDWRGLAEAYFGLGTADIHEGQHEASLENFGQALKLVGDHPAAFLLGKIYSNMAGACWFMKRPQEGIRFLEKAISYYERTDHKNNAADGYNNLGMNLVLVGQWDRAQEALERALSIGETGEAGAQVPMILDSLGELLMLRGDFEEARAYLDRAVALSA